MSAVLHIKNFGSGNTVEKTYLNADAAVAAVGITVKSVQNISTSRYLLIGGQAQENSEMKKVDAIVGQVITVTALARAHEKYDDITVLGSNQLKVYRAANVDGTVPLDAAFSVLATVDIDTDQLTTTYTDTGGGSGYWYKFTYYNSTTALETDIADSVATRGGAASHYASLDGIRQEAGFNENQYVADTLVAEKRDAAEDEINSALAGVYDVPFAEPVPPSITQITEMLAAAFLLTGDYGVFATGTNKDGYAKMAEARAWIKRLQTGDGGLVDGSGNTLVAISRVSGWPNDTTATATAENNGGDFMNRVTDVY